VLFQIIYTPFDEEYRNCTGRTPSDELQYCLQLQDHIISGITEQPVLSGLTNIQPGHIEIPPQVFWQKTFDFYTNYKPRDYFPESYLKTYSIQLGSWSKEHLAPQVFHDMAFNGKVAPAFFILYNQEFLPILPRRYSSILFDTWADIYEAHHDKVINDRMPYSMHIGKEVYKYVKPRINSSFLSPIVSAVKTQGSLHETLFSTVFISKNRLVLIYITNPYYSEQETEAELEEIAPKLAEAINLITTSPVTLALHLERKNVQFQARDGEELNPLLFVVIPQVKTNISSISIPKNMPGMIIFMDSFLGIIDELDSADMLASFIEYHEEYKSRIMPSLLSPLDIFGSFKDSLGILVEGALDFNLISLDPHWGSNLRFKTLSEFWKSYPLKHYIDHPRSWKVLPETKSRVRLEARGYFGCALYCKISQTHIFISSPFDTMSFEQALFANLFMECLEDTLSSYEAIIRNHLFFQYHDELHVLFFPLSLVVNNEAFKHIWHLIPKNSYWYSDCGLPKPTIYGIRIVFDDNTIKKALMETKDRSIEIDLLLEVIRRLNDIVKDDYIFRIEQALESEKVRKPRFKIRYITRHASFPEFINPYEPELMHFKQAKKKIAEIARNNGFAEGNYDLEEAKNKLNQLRDALVNEIDSEAMKYNFSTAIPYLISRIDALTNQFKHTTQTIEYSIEDDVDYIREERYAKQHSHHIRRHRVYRYLIEKFVQLRPSGELKLDKDHFQYLIALIDWLHAFYFASDSLHYGIHPVGMKVDNQFLIEVNYKGIKDEQEKQYAEEQSLLKLGLIGNQGDTVSSPRRSDNFLNMLDEAFMKDFKFTFTGMINSLQILTCWPEYAGNIELSSFYSSTTEEIETVCSKNIRGISQKEIANIIAFLILKPEDVICVSGQDERCKDLPVWEHKKRHARYTLRPLIQIDRNIYWGSYSTRTSGIVWSGSLSYGTLPIDLQYPSIQEVLRSEKQLIEDALVVKTLEIVKRYTPYAKSNVELHKLDKSAGYPPNLGDYDVFAFHQEKNIVFNIECKDILPVFCLKDAKSLRETIFGEESKDEGHFTHIKKRLNYLSDHLLSITRAVDWPVDSNKLPRVVTIYVTRHSYWWTRFPPKKVDAAFCRVDMLASYMEKL
jgi:hypothetical protein